jgi:hypothetical protein
MNLLTGDYNILRAKFLAAKSAFFHTLNHVSIPASGKTRTPRARGLYPCPAQIFRVKLEEEVYAVWPE